MTYTIAVIVHLATQHGKHNEMNNLLSDKFHKAGSRLKLRAFIRRITGYSYDALRAAEPRTPT